MAGLLAVLLVAMLGPAPAAASPICPDDTAVAAQSADIAGVAAASDAPADEICPEGCLACGHCQSHHAAASLPAAPAPTAEPFASPQRVSPVRTAALHSYLAHRLKRPPRA